MKNCSELRGQRTKIANKNDSTLQRCSNQRPSSPLCSFLLSFSRQSQATCVCLGRLCYIIVYSLEKQTNFCRVTKCFDGQTHFFSHENRLFEKNDTRCAGLLALVAREDTHRLDTRTAIWKPKHLLTNHLAPTLKVWNENIWPGETARGSAPSGPASSLR